MPDYSAMAQPSRRGSDPPWNTPVSLSIWMACAPPTEGSNLLNKPDFVPFLSQSVNYSFGKSVFLREKLADGQMPPYRLHQSLPAHRKAIKGLHSTSLALFLCVELKVDDAETYHVDLCSHTIHVALENLVLPSRSAGLIQPHHTGVVIDPCEG